jgi:deoxycytidylate deaminase
MNISKKIRNIFERLQNSKKIIENNGIKHLHYSVATRKGKVVSPVRYNQFKTYVFGDLCGSIHAEMSTCEYLYNQFEQKGVNKYKKFKNINIIVIRVAKSGIKNSKPCKDCILKMKNLNINKVYYSDDSGDLICEKLSNISNNHRSKMIIYSDKC